MSWQAYVDTNLLGSNKISKAAILGQKGGVWAASAGYTLSPQEQSAILAAHTNPDATQANGIRLCNQKFFTLSVNARSVYGKKSAEGCLLVKTKQAILVAEYGPPNQHAEVAKVVEGLADYLISVGY
ncbi:hypothetical protein Clacol_007159 [Clathrus columnatus]|uniref:Profilin n=1 Tax=Clathrus columnatus TaxID=1419009 RepID=A0AAV5AGZ5_9AGAM|nr:hypothetical protein Clacol_007159 [Clathrus columnatus]